MCNFLSAIYTKNDELIAFPEVTDSHSAILEMAGITDTAESFRRREFAKCELVPGDDLFDLDKWTFIVDEYGGYPEWFKPERAKELMLRRVKRMLIQNVKRIKLPPGIYVIRNSEIESMIDSRIFRIEDSKVTYFDRGWVDRALRSKFGKVELSAFQTLGDKSEIFTATRCEVASVHESQIQNLNYSVVGMLVSSVIGEADYSHIHTAAHSTIQQVGQTSVVSLLEDSSIGRLFGRVTTESNSTVGNRG